MILRKYFLVIMIGFALNMAFVTPASAAFGFGSCCSGYPCGTIPCDSGCAGKALSSMGTDVSSSANDADSAYDSLTDAIETVDESFESLGDDVVDGVVIKGDVLQCLVPRAQPQDRIHSVLHFHEPFISIGRVGLLDVIS